MMISEDEFLSLKPGDVVLHHSAGDVVVGSLPWRGPGGVLYFDSTGWSYPQSGIVRIVSRASDPKPEATAVNKYARTFMTRNDHTYDVYDVLIAFDVACPAVAHAVKKLLMAGERGHKDRKTDLREAIAAIERAIELEAK